jgi:hypothetical protein
MSDTPIMSWEQADQIIKDQRAEIERLREAIRRLADQDATLSVRDGNVTVEMDATLTDAEREAIETAMNAYGEHNDDPECETIEAALWGLLDRTK